MESSSSSVRVFCRFRPTRENHESVNNEVIIDETTNSISLGQRAKFRANVVSGNFHFDSVFPDTTTQENVYEKVGCSLMEDTFKGYNSSIIAYGQTGSGKTHTMFGPGWDEEIENEDNRANFKQTSLYKNENLEGLVPRIASNLFKEIAKKCRSNSKLDIDVYITIIEIYNETIRDLLKTTSDKQSSNSDNNIMKKLKIRETKNGGVFVEGVERRKIVSAPSLINAIRQGGTNRAVASTKMNDRSSRSHVIVGIHVLQRVEEADGLCSTTRSKISLVDLAGSERVGKTLASGQTLKEAQSINQSLSALGNCMRALTQPLSVQKQKSSVNPSIININISINKKKSHVRHIPYRDSKLTHLLKSSLGGNAKTTLIVAVASDMENLEETVSTLRFGIRAKRITNNAVANKSMTLQELHLQIQTLRSQVNSLSNENYSLKKELGVKNAVATDKNSINDTESITRLKQIIREKDTLFATEKIKTSSLEHSLKETKEKLKLAEESWNDMKKYGEELLVQLSQAEEQQIALQTSIIYHNKKRNNIVNAVDTTRNASDFSQLSKNGALKTANELQALRATIANEMELLDNWRSELYAWKTEIDEEQEKFNVAYTKQRADLDIEKENFENYIVETRKTINEDKNMLEKEKNEYLLQSRQLEKDKKIFKIKERQFKKDQVETNILIEAYEQDLEKFKAEKLDHAANVREREKYFNDLDTHYKNLRKELGEEWDVKVANEQWRNKLLEWRDKVTLEYEGKVQENQQEKASIRKMKEEFENQKLVFSSACKKKQLEIETKKEEYINKLQGVKKKEIDLRNKFKTFEVEQNQLSKMKMNYEIEEKLRVQEQEKYQRKIKEMELKIENLKIKYEENLEEELLVRLGKKEVEIENKIREKYTVQLAVFAQENKTRVQLEPDVLIKQVIKAQNSAQVPTMNLNRNVEKLLDNDNSDYDCFLPQKQIQIVSDDLPSQEPLEKSSTDTKIKRLSLLRKKKSIINQTITNSTQLIDPGNIATLSRQKYIKVVPPPSDKQVPKRRSSNYDRIKRLRELRDKVKAKSEAKEDISLELHQQMQDKKEECVKLMQENLNYKHELEHSKLNFIETKRQLDHEIKQSDIDKERIYDLEQQLLSLYASIALRQEEEKKYHEAKMQAANVAKKKMEEADLEYARQLSLQLNTGGSIDGTSSTMQSMSIPVFNENYFADETSMLGVKPQLVQSQVQSMSTGSKGNAIVNNVEDGEEIDRRLSQQMNLQLQQEASVPTQMMTKSSINNAVKKSINNLKDDEEVARKLSQSLNMQQMDIEPSSRLTKKETNEQGKHKNRRSSWSYWWSGGNNGYQ